VKFKEFSTEEVDAYYSSARSTKKDVPDHAIDKHTGRGKKLGRDLAHFFSEGCLGAFEFKRIGLARAHLFLLVLSVKHEPFDDIYKKEAMEKYLLVEKEKGMKQAKSTRFRASRREALDNGHSQKSKKRKADQIELDSDSDMADSDGMEDSIPSVKRVKRNPKKTEELELESESANSDVEELTPPPTTTTTTTSKSKRFVIYIVIKRKRLTIYNKRGEKIELAKEMEKRALPPTVAKNLHALSFDGTMLASSETINESDIIYNAV